MNLMAMSVSTVDFLPRRPDWTSIAVTEVLPWSFRPTLFFDAFLFWAHESCFGCRETLDLCEKKTSSLGPFIMLYLVGLGLADETDITVKGLEVVKRAERVYLEAYTSILHVGKEKLVGFNPCAHGRR